MFLKNIFQKKSKVEKKSYDRENLRPVIRASICTGEQTARFKDIRTGKFKEVMLIRTDADMAEFLEIYDIRKEEVKTEY